MRFDKTKSEIVKPFEEYLECITFRPGFFSKNHNCRVIYCGVQIDFFALDELIFGISDKIFSIRERERGDRETVKFIRDDIDNGTNKYPEVKSSSARMFYGSFEDRVLEYKNLFENLTVDERDYNAVVRLALEFPLDLYYRNWLKTISSKSTPEGIPVTGCRFIYSEDDLINYEIMYKKYFTPNGRSITSCLTSEKGLKSIIEIFIKSGNLHMLFLPRCNRGTLGVAYSVSKELSSRGLYYRCRDEDALYNFLLETSKHHPNKTISRDLASFYLNMDTSRQNYEKFLQIPNEFNKRTITLKEAENDDIDSMINDITKIGPGFVQSHLIAIVAKKILEGEVLSEKNRETLLTVENISKNIARIFVDKLTTKENIMFVKNYYRTNIYVKDMLQQKIMS